MKEEVKNTISFGIGTKILTTIGYKNIEDINTDDCIITTDGKISRVIDISRKRGSAISIKCQGFLETVVGTNTELHILKKKNNSYIGMPIINGNKNIFNLTKEKCWLLGRYVADGHYRKEKRKNRLNSFHYAVVYSIGKDKIDIFKECIKEHKFNYYKHSKSTYRAIFYSMDFVNFIINNNFGLGAENKRIPNFIFELPKELAEEFLNGYMSGDGSVIRNEIFQAGTISRELALDLCLLVLKCKNINTTISCHIPDKTKIIEGRMVNQSPYYTVRWRKCMNNRSKAFIENNVVWNPIKDKSEVFETELCELKLDRDCSYLANNMIFKN